MTHLMVRDVMTTDVVCAHEDTPFKETAELMAAREVSALPVLDAEGHVTGVVSESDLLRKEELREDPEAARLPWLRRRRIRAKAAGVTAKDVMTSPAITLGPDASVVEAARTLDRHHIKRLPVVAPDGGLAGIASRRDLMRVFLRGDEEIADEIRAGVFEESLGANAALVRVEVAEGRVTLAGEVERKSMIPLAVRLALAVDGVVDVVDNLTYAVDDTALPRTADVEEYRHTHHTTGTPGLKQVP